MKEIIARLKDLNKLDMQMLMLKKDMERLPRELSEKEILPRNLKASLERARTEITRLKIDADSAELEVKSGEEALKRYSTQMNVLRTSKEWDTVKRQMDAQRGWNKDNEGKALTLMEQIDTRTAEVEKNTAALGEAEKTLAAETERVQKEVAELKAQYDSIAVERAKLAQDLPEKELVTYNRIMGTRGQAIATVERGICSLCYMKLPPQFHNMVLLGKELVCCPSCGRILTT